MTIVWAIQWLHFKGDVKGIYHVGSDIELYSFIGYLLHAVSRLERLTSIFVQYTHILISDIFFIVAGKLLDIRNKESNFYRLVEAYRQHGHKCSDINPVSLSRHCSIIPELDLSRYGLENEQLVTFEGIIHCTQKDGTVKDAVDFLSTAYTKHVGAEFIYLEVRIKIIFYR